MARTPLFHQLRKIRAVAVESNRRAMPVEDVWHARTLPSRREFLRRAAWLAAASVVLPHRRLLAAGRGPSIAIIGGGLAGLTCAYRLKQAGIKATVYEGAERLGGRCFTLRGAFADGQTVERGGELIDTDHVQVRRLARELELTLDDLHAHEAPRSEELYFFTAPAIPGRRRRAISKKFCRVCRRLLRQPAVRLPGINRTLPAARWIRFRSRIGS